MATKRVTTQQVIMAAKAAGNEIDQGMANGMLRYLVATGKATIAGTQKAEGARGKGATIYEVEETISLTIG